MYVLRSSNMTALVRILSYVRMSGLSKMASENGSGYIPQNYHKPWRGRAWHRKHRHSRWNFVVIYKLRYMLFIPYPLPVKDSHLWYISHLDVFLEHEISGLPDISFISWNCSYIRSIGRYFEFVWARLIILRHLRHHKKWAESTSLLVGENRIK